MQQPLLLLVLLLAAADPVKPLALVGQTRHPAQLLLLLLLVQKHP